MTPEERSQKAWDMLMANPAMYPVPVIARSIQDAVDAERAACAREAESRCTELDAEGDGESVMASQALYGMANAGRAIAAAIRARGKA